MQARPVFSNTWSVGALQRVSRNVGAHSRLSQPCGVLLLYVAAPLLWLWCDVTLLSDHMPQPGGIKCVARWHEHTSGALVAQLLMLCNKEMLRCCLGVSGSASPLHLTRGGASWAWACGN